MVKLGNNADSQQPPSARRCRGGATARPPWEAAGQHPAKVTRGARQSVPGARPPMCRPQSLQSSRPTAAWE